MDVKFVTVERSLVDTVPITDGQIVVCRDSNDMFYDMGQTRRRVGPAMWQGVIDDYITPGFMLTDATVGIIQLVPNGGPDTQLQEGTPDNFAYGSVGEPTGLSNLPELTRDGFTFLGWYKGDLRQGEQVYSFPETFEQGKVVYYASWSTS